MEIIYEENVILTLPFILKIKLPSHLTLLVLKPEYFR